MIFLDTIDRNKILEYLEKNAKLTAKEIASMLALTEQEVENEIKVMEEEQLICGYHAFINWDKTEDDKISALVELKVTPQRGMGYDSIAKKIYKYAEVESLYLMSAGGYDFTVILKKATMREIANFVTTKLAVIEEVRSTSTHIVLTKYKEFGIALAEDKKDKRMVIAP